MSQSAGAALIGTGQSLAACVRLKGRCPAPGAGCTSLCRGLFRAAGTASLAPFGMPEPGARPLAAWGPVRCASGVGRNAQERGRVRGMVHGQ